MEKVLEDYFNEESKDTSLETSYFKLTGFICYNCKKEKEVTIKLINEYICYDCWKKLRKIWEISPINSENIESTLVKMELTNKIDYEFIKKGVLNIPDEEKEDILLKERCK